MRLRIKKDQVLLGFRRFRANRRLFAVVRKHKRGLPSSSNAPSSVGGFQPGIPAFPFLRAAAAIRFAEIRGLTQITIDLNVGFVFEFI